MFMERINLFSADMNTYSPTKKVLPTNVYAIFKIFLIYLTFLCNPILHLVTGTMNVATSSSQ